ncbi:MAG: hypothetical protein P4M11_02780, partial [Candidatus Pacebacteria bacterium]|nr:hypothetical protein [Candidatus Paceibacterota bacterium]
MATASTPITGASAEAPTTPAPQLTPSLQRFTEVPAQPPEAHFAIIGKTFATYSNQLTLTLGRSKSRAGGLVEGSDDTISLGEQKVISRQHMEIKWNPTIRRW